MPKLVERCRTSASSSTNEPGSSSCSTRSRAVCRPLSCWRAIADSAVGQLGAAPLQVGQLARGGVDVGGIVVGDRLGSCAHPRSVSRDPGPCRRGQHHVAPGRGRSSDVPARRAPLPARRSPPPARPTAPGSMAAVASTSMNVTTQPLDAEALRAAVVGPWAQLDVVERTGSTNADLMAAAAAGAPDRTVLVAEYQEAGRGRMTRSWVSPRRDRAHRERAAAPGRGARRPGSAGCRCSPGWPCWTPCAGSASAPAGLKWPNDVLIGTRPRKVAGILAEVADAHGPAVVIGIGLNVGAAPPDQPFATSLAAEGSRCGPGRRAGRAADQPGRAGGALAGGPGRPRAHPAARGLPRRPAPASAPRCGSSCPAEP